MSRLRFIVNGRERERERERDHTVWECKYSFSLISVEEKKKKGKCSMIREYAYDMIKTVKAVPIARNITRYVWEPRARKASWGP